MHPDLGWEDARDARRDHAHRDGDLIDASHVDDHPETQYRGKHSRRRGDNKYLNLNMILYYYKQID